MSSLPLNLTNGRQTVFEVDVGRQGPARFVLGVRKSGSSILNMICKALSAAHKCPHVDVGGQMFNENIAVHEWIRDPALSSIVFPGNLYGGFRDMPFGLLANDLFIRGPKLLMVRDPRDALVSEYFSNAYSHPIPKPANGRDAVTKMMERQRADALSNGIDEYVLQRASAFAGTMMDYASIAEMATTRTLRYEEYILQKAELIKAISVHFAWPVDERLIEKILEWADVRPVVENPRRFVRKVIPGDHKNKLRSDTIAKLNQILRPAMDAFGYSAPSS